MTAPNVPIASTDSTLSALAQADAERAREKRKAARSENTQRAYRQGVAAFVAWAETRGIDPLPAVAPDVVAAFLAAEDGRGLAPATVSLRAAAIGAMHQAANLPNPCQHPVVREVLHGIRREWAQGGGERKRADPVTPERLASMLATLDCDTVKGKRDAALLALGLALGARRSELAALDVEHLTFDAEGVMVRIARSKTDQTGEGAHLHVPRAGNPTLCAVRALTVWLEASGVTEGALFRRVRKGGTVLGRIPERTIDHIVRETARRARFEGRYSAHSLRAGLVTALAERGRTEAEIMVQSRHKSSAMVRLYTRPLDAKRACPLRGAW